jgi:F-type H+-transporting ATPase subunit b
MGLVTPDFGLLFWMLLTFLIVLLVLKKFAWKPILNSLKEREESIDDALKSAEKAREEMANLQASNEKILASARQEKEELLKEARDIRQKIIDEAKDKANQEANKLIELAKLAINNEKASAIEEMKQSIAFMSIQIAEKILRKELADPKQQQELIDKYLNNIKLN